MIDVYAGPTPNGRIPLIALAELDLPHRVHPVALFDGAQYEPDFLAMNPAAQIPVIVDRAPQGGDAITLSQTTAILLYLAEKSGRGLPEAPHSRARALEALSLHATDLAPSFYLAYHLERLLGSADADVRRRLQLRGFKYYQVLEQWIGEGPWLAGESVSLADMAAYPWISMFPTDAFDALPGIAAWRERMGARPAVAKAMATPLD